MKNEGNPVDRIVQGLTTGKVDVSNPRDASIIANAMLTLCSCQDTMAILVRKLTGEKEPYQKIRSAFDRHSED
jgi:hypothetical protein